MNNLERENQILKQKLKVAQKWIKREILANIKSINISQPNYETKTKKDNFFSENIEEIIYHKTMDFLWEEIFMYASKDVLEYVISSEILFFTLRNNKNLDWLWIITSYQKSFDLLVEEHITKPFRKYFHSKKIFPYLENDALEKSLYLTVSKGHILGFWRLFSLLKNIFKDAKLWLYSEIFKEFLEKYSYIKKIILEPEFLEIYEKIIDLETFWAKRHIWKVNFDDVVATRKYFLWDLENKNCLFYKLFQIYDSPL